MDWPLSFPNDRWMKSHMANEHRMKAVREGGLLKDMDRVRKPPNFYKKVSERMNCEQLVILFFKSCRYVPYIVGVKLIIIRTTLNAQHKDFRRVFLQFQFGWSIIISKVQQIISVK